MKFTWHTFVQVIVDDALTMTEAEARELVKQEFTRWSGAYGATKILGRVEIYPVKDSGDEVLIRCFEKSPVRRVRRITGYLSEVDNFNAAKRAELDARMPQTKE